MDLFRVICKRVSGFKLNKRYIVLALLAATFSVSLYKTVGANSVQYLHYGPTVEQRIAIPEEILKSKDCKEFFKWQNENIGPMLPRHRCPWMKYNPIRNIEIDNVNLSIPRGYLTGSSSIEPDGKEDDGILLSYPYPEPTGGFDNRTVYTRVFIMSVSKYIKKHNKTDEEHGYEYYWSFILNINQEEDEFEVIDNGYNEELNRKHYIIKNTVRPRGVNEGLAKELIASGKLSRERIDEFSARQKNKPISYYYRHVFTNDNPLKPHEYIVCDDGEDELTHKTFCKSGFFYKGLYIKINFPKKDLGKFDYLKNEFLTLMKQWETNYDNR